jgi:hypothetical protein
MKRVSPPVNSAQVADLQHKKNRPGLTGPVYTPNLHPKRLFSSRPLIHKIASLFVTLHLVGYTPALCATVRLILVRSGRFYAESCIQTSENSSSTH